MPCFCPARRCDSKASGFRSFQLHGPIFSPHFATRWIRLRTKIWHVGNKYHPLFGKRYLIYVLWQIHRAVADLIRFAELRAQSVAEKPWGQVAQPSPQNHAVGCQGSPRNYVCVNLFIYSTEPCLFKLQFV